MFDDLSNILCTIIRILKVYIKHKEIYKHIIPMFTVYYIVLCFIELKFPQSC